MSRDKRALIDGDIVVYQACSHLALWGCGDHLFNLKKDALAYREETGNNEDVIRLGDYSLQMLQVIIKAEDFIKEMMERTGSYDCSIYLTESGEENNFRHSIAKTQPYKGHRKAEKPRFYTELREYMMQELGATVTYGEEADDAIGIEHYKYYVDAEYNAGEFGYTPTVFCSRDKDRLTIPGWTYDPFTKKMEFITEEQANKFFYKQILIGDRADNVPGLHGVGPVKADKIIDPCKTTYEMYKAVLNNFKERLDLPPEEVEDRVLEIGRLLRIRRFPNEIWSPEHEAY